MNHSGKQGEVTAFLSMVFILLISFISGILQIVSIQTAKNISRLETDRAIFSVFGEYEKTLLEDYHVFALEGSYGSGDYKEENILRRMHYYGSTDTQYEITAVQYLTDNFGQAFREQVLAYMEQKFGIGMIRNITGMTEEWKHQEIKGKDMEEKEKSFLDRLNEIKESSEQEIEEDPFTCMEEIEKSGLLSVVLPKEMKLSGREVSLEKQASYRRLTSGRGSFPMRGNMDGIEEKLLYNEYVLRCFENAGMERNGESQDEEEKKQKPLLYEVEYILEGKKSDRENLEAVLMKIFLIRMALNYAYLMGAAEKQTEAKALAVTISIILLNPELEEPLSQLILLAWAAGESIVDIRTLLSGKKAPLLKNSGNWQVSLFSLFTLGKGSENMQGNGAEEGISYEEYLRAFLFLKDKESITMRTIDRIEENLSEVRKMEFFRADQCITKIQTKNTMKLYGNITYDYPAYFGYE